MSVQDKPDAMAAARDKTEPSEAAIDRLTARLRTSVAEDGQIKAMLKALPEPEADAAHRVVDRIRRPSPKRFRLAHFALGGAAVAAAAVLLMVLMRPKTRDTSERPQIAQQSPPIEQPPEAAPPPETTPDAPPQAHVEPPEPPPKIEPQTQLARAKVTEFSTSGQTDPAGAKRRLDQLKTTFAACLQKVPAARSLAITVALDEAGKPLGVKAKGAGAKAFQGCIRAPVLAERFGEGQDLRAGVERAVAGGVLRFKITRQEP